MQDQSKSKESPQNVPAREPALPLPAVVTPEDLAKISGAGPINQVAPHGNW